MNEQMMDKESFSRKYEIENTVVNSITHGIGVLLSIAGLVLLILKGLSSGGIQLFAYMVFGISLILLYLASTIYHSLYLTRAKNIFRRIDHSSIFILIAGTYTPFCLIAIKGTLGYSMFVIVWVLALTGIVLKSCLFEKIKRITVPLYLAMGWLIVFAIKNIYTWAGPMGLGLLMGGGLVYSLGTIFYKKKKMKFSHGIWHVFVMGGSILMFFSVYIYV